MGLFGAMTASVSGLGAQGQAISVISDNLANTNTIGYKASRSLFSQLVTSSGGSGTSYNAGGVGTSITRDQSSQGSFITSSSKTDLAISGNGFFRVADNKTNGSDTSFYYTRAGSFAEDKEGYLVNPDGYYLQGWKTDADGTIQNIQEPRAVELQSVGVSAQETSELAIDANLNSTEGLNGLYVTTGGSPLKTSLDTVLANPTLADYVTDLRVYDAQGGARDMTIAFVKRAANTWDWMVYTDGSNVQGGTAGSNVAVGKGTLEFTTTGALKYVQTTDDNGLATVGSDMSVTWAGGVNTSNITLNFGDYVGGLIAAPSGTVPATYANGVLGVSVEDNAFTAGQYTIVAAANGDIQLRAGNGVAGTLIESIPAANVAASGTRELYFATSKLRVTVSTSFDEQPDAGPAAAARATFTVADQPSLDKGVGTDGVTQLAANYNTSAVNQNGFGAGTLASIQVDEDGFVNGTFTNGETKKLFKIALAVFQNPRGLEALSGSLLRTTEKSGQALLKQAGVGGTGRLVGGSLEGSTTDIAGEFSNMIVAQRAFQASSKVITTVDQMLNDLLQLR